MKMATLDNRVSFSVDETAFCWKKRPSRTFHSWREVNVLLQSFKAQTASLLGADATGDLMLKPMFIYHSESPRAFKNYAKTTLPVLYKWSNKA